MEYQYQCKLCGENFNLIQSMKDDPIKLHKENKESKCEGEVVRIITGGTGIIFKGTGWTPKHYNRTGKKLDKIDRALGKMGNVEDASGGWSKGD